MWDSTPARSKEIDVLMAMDIKAAKGHRIA